MIISGSVLSVLVIVLCIHIYIVTRPKPLDPSTVAMARMDIKQDINTNDAAKITALLYAQNGVSHVLVNPTSKIAVFTYFPSKTTADAVIGGFKSQSDYTASRFMPTAQEMKSGCPVMSPKSIRYKVYSFFKHIF